jgi:hypothetical protein
MAETSLYDEDLQRRKGCPLRLLGISKDADVIGTNGNAYYARIEPSHPILDGFSNTNWLPGAQNRMPVKSVPRNQFSPLSLVSCSILPIGYPRLHTMSAVVLCEVASSAWPTPGRERLLAYRSRRLLRLCAIMMDHSR